MNIKIEKENQGEKYSFSDESSQDSGDEFQLKRPLQLRRKKRKSPSPVSSVSAASSVKEFDDNTFIVAPTPDSAYEVELHYYYRPASLTTTSGSETTWLSKNAPNAMLYGSLVEACTYLKNYEAIPAYESKFQEALLGLKNLGEAKSTRDQYRYDEIRRQPQA